MSGRRKLTQRELLAGNLIRLRRAAGDDERELQVERVRLIQVSEADLRQRIELFLHQRAHKKLCRGNTCGQQLWWLPRPGKKAHPYNLDGSSHFSTCSDAPAFRKGQG